MYLFFFFKENSDRDGASPPWPGRRAGTECLSEWVALGDLLPAGPAASGSARRAGEMIRSLAAGSGCWIFQQLRWVVRSRFLKWIFDPLVYKEFKWQPPDSVVFPVPPWSFCSCRHQQVSFKNPEGTCIALYSEIVGREDSIFQG